MYLLIILQDELKKEYFKITFVRCIFNNLYVSVIVTF